MDSKSKNEWSGGFLALVVSGVLVAFIGVTVLLQKGMVRREETSEKKRVGVEMEKLTEALNKSKKVIGGNYDINVSTDGIGLNYNESSDRWNSNSIEAVETAKQVTGMALDFIGEFVESEKIGAVKMEASYTTRRVNINGESVKWMVGKSTISSLSGRRIWIASVETSEAIADEEYSRSEPDSFRLIREKAISGDGKSQFTMYVNLLENHDYAERSGFEVYRRYRMRFAGQENEVIRFWLTKAALNGEGLTVLANCYQYGNQFGFEKDFGKAIRILKYGVALGNRGCGKAIDDLEAAVAENRVPSWTPEIIKAFENEKKIDPEFFRVKK